jgi:3-oxoacyl-[acyl-carrier protein] reductase
MYLPGERVLLTSTDARFPAPLQYPSRVRVRGEITTWNPQTGAGRLRVTIGPTGGSITADIVLGFTLHEFKTGRSTATTVTASSRPVTGAAVLVTGASGGIGQSLVDSLTERYPVIAATRTGGMPGAGPAQPRVQTLTLDFCDPEWVDRLRAAIPEHGLYGIIHCAWPGPAQGGLLTTPTDVLTRQMAFGTTHLVELARLLRDRIGPDGGRLIAIGSTYGTRQPRLNLAGYSLAKAVLEHTVRLLAAELALKNVTVNALCPSFVPVGMNRRADERRKMLEAASIPAGRLCRPTDIAAAAEWLLSPGASFTSGQVIALSGGQL